VTVFDALEAILISLSLLCLFLLSAHFDYLQLSVRYSQYTFPKVLLSIIFENI
jgi:hypothetical protein